MVEINPDLGIDIYNKIIYKSIKKKSTRTYPWGIPTPIDNH
jgi:retron-type reverse transcriptase